MKIISSLGSRLTSSLPIEKKQRALVEFVINTYQPQQRADLFRAVTDHRKNQLLNLFPEHHNKSFSVLFKLMDYRELIRRYPNTLGEEIAHLEQAVSECYPHWLDFWCECEIAAIKTLFPIEADTPPRIELPLKDCAYRGFLIDQIEDSELWVTMPSHPQKMPIKDAITLSNLELFIKGEKWYEMLPLLSLSQKGKHFVLLKHPDNEASPTLVASMLVQDWSVNQTWLSYVPQFSNKQWQFCLPDHSYDVLMELQLFKPALSKCDSLPEFDQQFQLQLADKRAVCEVLRLTVSGNAQQKLYFLYLAQKKFMQVMHQVGYKIGFTIIEQPFMLSFYQAINPKAYFHCGYCDLNNDGVKTYRGFWNFESINRVFSNADFRDYKHAVSQSRKYDLIKKEEYA
ncbi:acyl-homoserine-lactone synthase [Vibrio sp. V19_P1S1T109]|uniref:acyl-homoserine-lactone synthase n=1 Tax=Vibrio sp. V19_P1S1T109 TaxID=1938672 RepID=UPI000B8E9638|nr:acyl-homoserine-lactone synthase [Vibrio sp. V19_P1S1T109]OXX69306.1 acyl-homoserine-lactone synthase [Vibrio sp. V19_P1S1T109]